MRSLSLSACQTNSPRSGEGDGVSVARKPLTKAQIRNAQHELKTIGTAFLRFPELFARLQARGSEDYPLFAQADAGLDALHEACSHLLDRLMENSQGASNHPTVLEGTAAALRAQQSVAGIVARLYSGDDPNDAPTVQIAAEVEKVGRVLRHMRVMFVD